MQFGKVKEGDAEALAPTAERVGNDGDEELEGEHVADAPGDIVADWDGVCWVADGSSESEAESGQEAAPIEREQERDCDADAIEDFCVDDSDNHNDA